jgi:hypothetical protein
VNGNVKRFESHYTSELSPPFPPEVRSSVTPAHRMLSDASTQTFQFPPPRHGGTKGRLSQNRRNAGTSLYPRWKILYQGCRSELSVTEGRVVPWWSGGEKSGFKGFGVGQAGGSRSADSSSVITSLQRLSYPRTSPSPIHNNLRPPRGAGSRAFGEAPCHSPGRPERPCRKEHRRWEIARSSGLLPR